MQQNAEAFKKKYWYGTKVLLVLSVMAFAFIFIPDLIFLIFGGVLFGIFLSSVARFLQKLTRVRYTFCVGFTVVALLLTTGLTGYLMAPSLGEQFNQLSKELPTAFNKVTNEVSEYSWARKIKSQATPTKVLSNSSTLLSKASSAFNNILQWIMNFFILILIGLYCAFEPGVYKNGLIKLFPKEKRSRVNEVATELDETLKWWLIGKFFGMVVIGVLTFIGLQLMDLPLALALAIIAAVLTFIPTIGPIIASVPAVLLGLVESPEKALYIAALYSGIQIIESYFLTPLVQRKTISLPPALTLSAQLISGYLVGGIGLAFATPFIAAILVMVKMLYIEDKLNDRVELSTN